MNFILNPIGKIYKKNSVYCFIKEDFFDALKFLDKFSHLILFTYPNENKKYVCLKKTDIQDFFDDNLIYCQVCRIIGINEKKGLIELDNCFADDSDFIIDIKPYFPIEDRIRIEDVSVFQKDNSYKDFVSKYKNFKNQKLPENENIYSEWRIDFEKKSMIKNFDDKLLNHEISFNEKIEISQIGSIYNESGKTLLKFNEEFNKKIELLKNFSHIKVLWWFSRFDEEKYRKAVQCNPPYEKAPRTGIFASRSPVRPNPIALTTARIKKINFDTMTVEITEIDAFDKTPVISIKPYIPCYDRVRHFEVPEWLNHWSEWNYENKKNEINIEEFKNYESDFEKLKNEFFPKIIGTEEKKLDSVNKSEEKQTDNEIVISGCRHHNLKNISLKIPKNKLIVVTGVSGSGKSSLVFDTIYAESQRRFIDSLSTTGRQSFEQFEKPDVDKISGLPPAIAVEQKSINKNPRSTVGTMTEIYDYLRLLYSRIGIRHCPDCGSAVQPKSEYEIINLLFELSIKNKITICYAENDEKIDDIVIGADDAGREFKTKLKEIVRNALIKGRGALGIIVNGKKYILHTRNKCYHCGRIFFDLTSSYFSYNNHEGMCKKCKGLGYTLTVLPELVVSNPEISLLDGASVWYGNLRQQIQNPTGNWWKGEVIALAELMNVNLELPWKDLPAEFKNKALYGSDGEKVIFKYSSARGRKGEITRPVFGAVNNIERMFRDTQGEASRKFYMQFMQNEICSDCRGERLNIEGRLVTVAEIRYPQAAQMSIRNLMNWTAGLQENLE